MCVMNGLFNRCGEIIIYATSNVSVMFYYRVSRGIEYTMSRGVYIIFSISYGFFLLLASHGSFGNDFLRRR
jgi:hypothetical protein